MSILIKTVIEEILEDLTLATDGSGAITKAQVGRYVKQAQTTFNDLTLILKTSYTVQAIADQIEYDLPGNFKTNLTRVVHNHLPLRKANKDFLDSYDNQWRDPVNQAAVSSTPLYFLNQLVTEGKFIIYPPPDTSGDSVNLNRAYGIPQSITLGGTSYSLQGSSGGIVRSITVDGEVISLQGVLGGIPMTITPKDGNIVIEYIKEPEDSSIATGFIEIQLERYINALKAFAKAECYKTEARFNPIRYQMHMDVFSNEVLIAKNNIERAQPKIPISSRPVYTRADLGAQDLFISI